MYVGFTNIFSRSLYLGHIRYHGSSGTGGGGRDCGTPTYRAIIVVMVRAMQESLTYFPFSKNVLRNVYHVRSVSSLNIITTKVLKLLRME